MPTLGPDKSIQQITAWAKQRGRQVVVMTNHKGEVAIAPVEGLERADHQLLILPPEVAVQLLEDLCEAIEFLQQRSAPKA